MATARICIYMQNKVNYTYNIGMHITTHIHIIPSTQPTCSFAKSQQDWRAFPSHGLRASTQFLTWNYCEMDYPHLGLFEDSFELLVSATRRNRSLQSLLSRIFLLLRSSQGRCFLWERESKRESKRARETTTRESQRQRDFCISSLLLRFCEQGKNNSYNNEPCTLGTRNGHRALQY